MKPYFFRVAVTCTSSELIPAFFRRRLLRALGFEVADTACIWPHGRFRSNLVRIQERAFINIGFYHDGDAFLEIGRNVRIGPYVRVLTAGHEIGTSDQRCVVDVVASPVKIADGCWIGAGVTIMPGVTIAKGCVIGANSVVIRSTDPNGLYAGAPARRIRDLESGARARGRDYDDSTAAMVVQAEII